ncbi:MAG: hypothetical protein JXA90_16840, partial [Planctomycetes bacterium]|nr:hypothetical protein [Planctomycetota bacterium]
MPGRPAGVSSRGFSAIGALASVITVMFLVIFLALARRPAGSVLAAGLEEAPGEYAIVGATLHIGDGRSISDGAVIVRGSAIEAAGPRDDVSIPPLLPRIEAAGWHLTPGLVAVRSRLSLDEQQGPSGGPLPIDVAAEALTSFDDAAAGALAEGVTTAGVSLAARRGRAGLGAVVRLRSWPAPETGSRDSAFELIVRDSHLVLGLGLASGRSTSAERLQQYYELRGLFLAARDHEREWRAYWKSVEAYNRQLESYRKAKQAAAGKAGEQPKPGEKGGPRALAAEEEKKKEEKAATKEGAGESKKSPPAEPKPPSRPKRPQPHAGHEALLRALAGEIPVIVEAHRRDDIE